VNPCITANYLDTRSIYPVLDPRRTAGPGPTYRYAYSLALDGLQINVTRLSGLSNCKMIVNFSSTLTEGKEIQAWNMLNHNFVDRIGSAGLGLASSMTITQAMCGTGADTLILCRYYAWPQGRTALYTFPPQDFWDFWGGCSVVFNWLFDNAGSGLWGNQTPAPTYPLVRLPDGTVMRDAAGTGFMVVFGGAAFTADTGFLAAAGLNQNPVLAFSAMPRLPADFTLVREIFDPKVFVVFGGAKFWIPDPLTLHTLGFDFPQVRVVPSGGTAQIGTLPIDGTLIKEQHDPKVFFVENGQLRWVTSPAAMDTHCLSWRHVRTAPDTSLAALARGPDLM
jgi:hypothetical protein